LAFETLGGGKGSQQGRSYRENKTHFVVVESEKIVDQKIVGITGLAL
jgi:hypothetical protein